MLVKFLSKRNIINLIISLILSVLIIYPFHTYGLLYASVIFLLFFIVIQLSLTIMSTLEVPLGEENLGVYFILMSSFLVLSPDMHIIPFVSTLIITYLLFIVLMKFNSAREIKVTFFLNISLLTGIIIFIYPPLMIMGFFLILAALFTSKPGKKIIITIIGYLTAFYLGSVAEMLLWHKSFAQVWDRLTDIHLISYNHQYNIIWLYLAILALLSLMIFIAQKNSFTLKIRKIFWLIFIFQLNAFAANLFISEKPIFPLVYSVSIPAAYFFQKIKLKSYLKNIILISLIIFVLLLGFNLI